MPLNLRPFPRDYHAISLPIQPQSEADRDMLVEQLQSGALDLGPISVSGDPESGLIMFDASSEQLLDAAVTSVRGAGIAISAGSPMIAYREILAGPVEADYTHAKQSSVTNQFARVRLSFEPSTRTMNNVLVNEIEGAAMPDGFLAGAEKGFLSVCSSGPMLGFPVVACRAALVDAAWHDTDSSPLAFEIAARAALRQAATPEGALKLLEPYLEVDITAPDAFTGSIVGDFRSRRGVNTLKQASPGVSAIYGFAPLANMLGYEASLASLTRGQATYSWKLAGLEEVPSGSRPDTFSPAAAKRA